jgi:hypothetical protein
MPSVSLSKKDVPFLLGGNGELSLDTTSEPGIGTRTIFAVFDSLVRLASKADPANVGVLRLASKANGKDVEKLFMTPSAAEG